MITLEKFRKESIPELLLWLEHTNAEFLIQFAGRKYTYPLTDNQLIQTLAKKSNIMFKVVESNSQITIGHCQLLRIDKVKKSASVGRVFIREEYRGKKYSSGLIECVKSYGIEILGLKKLSLRVFDFNIPAVKCYSKAGFKEVKKELQFYQSIQKEWCCITMEYCNH